jgi:hypothetical protein
MQKGRTLRFYAEFLNYMSIVRDRNKAKFYLVEIPGAGISRNTRRREREEVKVVLSVEKKKL